MIRKQLVYFFVVSTIVATALAEGNVGDVCFMRDTRAQGVCKSLSDCPAVQELAKNGVSPTLCGIPGLSNNYIVCCEGGQNAGNGPAQPNDNSFLDTDSFVFPENADPVVQIQKSRSEEKCAEYSKLVTGSVSAAPLITDLEQGIISVDVEKCDYTSVPLIVGGTFALAGEFPFMAALGYNDENEIGWFCGGTLISEFYVVTAAHCARTKFYGPPVKVRLGELDLKSENDGSVYVDYDVVDIKAHEKYRPPSTYHDIALLKLAQKVEFTKFIRPACIWSKNTLDTDKTIATGWGKTGIAEDQSSRLLKVALSIFDNSRCSKSYPPNSRTLPNGIQPTMMCAGELKGGKDTCQGDSGGPLVITKDNRCVFHIVGITSFGKGCGGPNLPAVYTRVSEYVTWIESIIW